MSVSKSDFSASKLGITLYSRNELDYFNKFFRFGVIDPYNTVTHTKEYVFFTKPDLHLFDAKDVLNPELSNFPIFKETYERFPGLLEQLQISLHEQSSPFINIFTTKAKSGIDLPSIDSGSTQTGSTIFGDFITYHESSIESDNNHEFAMEFSDDKYLRVYRLLKIWDEYTRLKDNGLITPPNTNYIFNKELHDQVAAYKFIVGEDGTSIIFVGKVYGVFPTRVPRDAFSNLQDGELSISTSFHGQWVIDTDPNILSDFKKLVKPYATGSIVPIYNEDYDCLNTEPVRCPDIIYNDNKYLSPYGKGNYELVWRD